MSSGQSDFVRAKRGNKDTSHIGSSPNTTQKEYKGACDSTSSAHLPMLHEPLQHQPQSFIQPISRRGPQEPRRQPSPVSSFLDQIPLDNRPDLRALSSNMRSNHDTKHSRVYENTSTGRSGRQGQSNQAIAASEPSGTLKRSAPPSEQLAGWEEASKRQRPRSLGEDRSAVNGSPVTSRTTPRQQVPITSKDGRAFSGIHLTELLKGELQPEKLRDLKDLKSPIVHRNQHPATKKVIFVDAGTQTANLPISSSKLATLQEEEAIAQAKHNADMARRKEALTLELEYERQVLELRRQFEIPTAKGDGVSAEIVSEYVIPKLVEPVQATEATNENGSGPNASDELKGSSLEYEQLLAPEQASKTTLRNETGPNANDALGGSSPEYEPEESNPGLKVLGASRNQSAVQQKHSGPDVTAATLPAATGPSPTVDRQYSGQADLNTKDRHGLAQGSTKESRWGSAEIAGRPRSSSTASLRIKTSPSPAHIRREPRDRRGVEAPRWPAVKHLTCYFWKRGKCYKSGEECSYAHYDTGNVAMDPVQMRRINKNDLYRPRGAW
ncbi:MAG: hypothetical protein Q9179_005851 [Wetmoreana sp. 5 TL-2023]